MQGFLKQVEAAENRGLSVDYPGERIVDIHETDRPRLRYALGFRKLLGWTLPRLLPGRMLDWIVGRIGGLKK